MTNSSQHGYSGTPLGKKLGLKPGHRLYTVNAPTDYWSWLEPLPEDLKILKRPARNLDFVHLFVVKEKEFKRRLASLKHNLAKTGMIWVSWPKKSSGVATDLDGNQVRKIGLDAGLVDIKVCAVDETWSGLKFVIPVKQR